VATWWQQCGHAVTTLWSQGGNGRGTTQNFLLSFQPVPPIVIREKIPADFRSNPPFPDYIRSIPTLFFRRTGQTSPPMSLLQKQEFYTDEPSAA
jgi:hypothetical protein